MEIRVETTKESYLKTVKAAFRQSLDRIIFISIGVSIIGSLTQNDKGFVWKKFLTDAFFLFILTFLIICIISFLRSFKPIKAALNELKKKPYHQIFTLLPNGINIHGERGDKYYNWSEIKKVYSIPDYLSILINNNTFYVIPLSAFASSEDQNEFLEKAQNGVNETSKLKYPKPQYYWGFLGLVPIVGGVNGIIMTISGISKYKNLKYVFIGLAGILINVFYFGALFYYLNDGSLSNDKFFRKGFTDMSQAQLNSLVKEVEFYKIEHGIYPDSLKQLEIKNGFISIHDPVIEDKRNDLYYYRRVGNKYTLFSSGIDGIPNTTDDIYPSIKIDTAKIGLIIRQ